MGRRIMLSMLNNSASYSALIAFMVLGGYTTFFGSSTHVYWLLCVPLSLAAVLAFIEPRQTT